MLYKKASAILVDTPGLSHYGGTGATFDWGVVPVTTNKPVILAGGLNAANIEQAIQTCEPYAVDVCSGVELSPGIKDHEKMKRFIHAIRRQVE